ncbi:CNNM domain-containing protein [Hyphococcus formosus]|uniref:CNNM domain-containing protein n=1 Tax=Hyphococcus formosus TaxID=3143534 RepID=UPI00398B1F8F
MLTSLFAFLLVSIVVSFLCSLWESVLLSISPSYMKVKLDAGDQIGETLSNFKNNIDRPLAGILTLNTIGHTVGAIGVGQEATKIWAESNPLITGLAVPAATTAAILILSEIIPKTIGATNWKALAPFTVRSLKFILFFLAPIVWLCQLTTRVFTRNKEQSIFSRTDFLAMAQIGSEEGALDQAEVEFIHNILHFKNFKARQIMTPRTVTVSAPQTMTAREFYDHQEELTFSRVPLRESPESENFVGYVLKDEILEHLIDDDGEKTLADFKRNIVTVPENYSIFQLFNDFIETRDHIALVTDDFGSMSGVVTMEDVIETLLGSEIVDETDQIVDMQDMAKQRWKDRRKALRRLTSITQASKN